MLVQFTVANFLSFKDKAVFSLLATNDESHPEHLVPNAVHKGKMTLRAAAIYGANASGKSNLVKAIAFARDLIVQGTAPDDVIGVTPFKMRSFPDQPSKFQFVFCFEGIEYTYGFVLNNVRIIEEYLYASPKGQRVIYFERVTSEDLETQVDPGASLVKRSQVTRRFLEYKEADTRHNELFLSAIFAGNIKDRIEELKPVMKWFRSVLTIIEPETMYRRLEVRTHRTEELKSYLGKLLKTSGTGIQAVVTTEELFNWDRDIPWLPPQHREEVLQSFKKRQEDLTSNDYTVEIGRSDGERFYLRQDENGDLWSLKLLLKHSDDLGTPIDFRMNEESDGTRRIIHLAPMLFDLSEGRERVIVIDELDRRLHPHLSRMMVQAAMQCRYANQFIFTTHDTNLLDLDLLRRDEIWFVEKKSDGSSHLYSLAEFKVRPDLQIEKGYLNGRFGAIPFIGDIGTLGWRENLELAGETANGKATF